MTMKFLEIAETALAEAGQKGDSTKVINKQFIFECRSSQHQQILIGTVLALEISDEDGLCLQVSSPFFKGKKLVCLRWDINNRTWEAIIEPEMRSLDDTALTKKKIHATNFFPGVLKLM